MSLPLFYKVPFIYMEGTFFCSLYILPLIEINKLFICYLSILMFTFLYFFLFLFFIKFIYETTIFYFKTHITVWFEIIF